jgi:aldose 1-epimerase
MNRASILTRDFGRCPDGSVVTQFTLACGGIELQTITRGGTIISLRVPDRFGHADDIVLGFSALEPYVQNTSYFGAIVGRYANRIAHGRFSLDGRDYTLAQNDGPNHLHGGRIGFDRHEWRAEPEVRADAVSVSFRRTSPDDEEGYPGTLRVAVTYTLVGDCLTIDYEAHTDAPTVVNLTQHTYFNLGGPDTHDILDHELIIDADRFTPVDATLIPTGTIEPVGGTPFDFRAATRFGDRAFLTHPQLLIAGGFDHNFVLNGTAGELRRAAELVHPPSGRRLRVHTTEPGLQLYGGHLLDGRPFPRFGGLCLETQHFPDSPNRAEFPPTTLRPPHRYHSRTVWEFGATSRSGRALAHACPAP